MMLLSRFDVSNGNIRSFLIIAVLRLLTGITQFTLILLLASSLSLEDFGVYTMFTIYASYFALLAGFNFHTYTIREMGRVDRECWPNLFVQSGYFIFFNGCFVILLAMLLYCLKVVYQEVLLFFLLILIFTTINNQVENFLVGAGYPTHSALSIFIKVLWILPLLLLVKVYKFDLSLSSVFLAWIVSEFFALIYLAIVLYYLRLTPSVTISINYSWIIKGWKVGLRYTFLGLLLTAAITIQRVILGETHSKEDVGVFQIFFTITVFLPNLIESSVFAVLLPKLIKKSNEAGAGVILVPRYILSLFLLAAVSTCLIVVYMMLPFILSIFGKKELTEYKSVFVYIAIYSLLYFSSRLFHYQLYSASKDRILIYVNIVSFSVALLSSILFIPPFGIMGAAYSLVMTGLTMLVLCSLPFLLRLRALRFI